MIRQFTTHASLSLLVVLGGCTHNPIEPARSAEPVFDNSRNPGLLTPDLYPVAPSEREVRYGRYALVNTTPGVEQRDLMAQIIDINIPANMRPTVHDAMQYVLNRSGYSMCGRNEPHVNILFTRPLPAAQYKLGPMSLRNTLQVLAGPAWQVKVDEVSRSVCFTLRPGYQLPDPPTPMLATTSKPSQAKTATVAPSTASAKPVTESKPATTSKASRTPPTAENTPPVATAKEQASSKSTVTAKPAPVSKAAKTSAKPAEKPKVASSSSSSVSKAPPPRPVWTARVGSTLRESVDSWAKTSKWRVIWECTDLDYRIDAPLHFSGTFTEAVAEIFPLWDEADRSFLVNGNPDQRIVVVRERKKK